MPVATIRVQADTKSSVEVLKAKPAKVRRVIRDAMAKAGRLSARRVKDNVRDRKRTGALQGAEGQVVKTYQNAIVLLVGARKGFKRVDPTFGNVDPANYDHLIELGRNVSVGNRWLALRFPSQPKLFQFLDRRFAGKGESVTRRRKTGKGSRLYYQLVRKYGRDVAARVTENNRGKGCVFFIKKAGPTRPGYAPVGRDADNTASDVERIINDDLRTKLGQK